MTKTLWMGAVFVIIFTLSFLLADESGESISQEGWMDPWLRPWY